MLPAADIYSATINGGFAGNDFYQINGIFPAGTIIAPYAQNLREQGQNISITIFDTSWTNAGLINGGQCVDCTPTPTAAVPEPSTWAMMILGFAGVGFMAYRRKQNGPKLRFA